MVLEARRAVNHLAVFPLWYSRLATITSPRELDLALTSCLIIALATFPTDGANCRVVVFELGLATDRIQAQRTRYNEFVESGSKSWALMGRQLIWEWVMIKQKLRTRNQTALCPREKGLLVRGGELPAPLASQELAFLTPSFFFSGISLMLYIYTPPPFILLLHLLVIHVHT